MSELREEILGAGINKKRIIGVILVAVLLTAVFAFSTVFFSFLFGSLREPPNKQLEGQTYEEALLIKPPSPFDLDFWQNLFENYNITDLSPEMLEMLAEMLSEMMDGDIDNLDLGNFSEGLLPLLFGAAASEIEVFRVFNYLDFNDMQQVLWKYEAFDEYTGDGWESTATTDLYDFYPYVDYLSKYDPDPELLTIKMPLSPDIGSNSFTIPTLFPSPFIIEDTFSAPNLNTGTEQLYKDEYNSTTVDLSFSSDNNVNITFDMFGLYNHLPTPDELNNTAIEASYTPSYIANRYLKLPPTIAIYRNDNAHFNNHLTALEGIIDANDNAFDVANTIRNYLQTHFSFPQTQDDYEPAPEGTDAIDWFCETEQGVWSDFASAFCAFSRAFGIASRFVDGFNSYWSDQIFDDDLGQNGFAIKYKNLYNWAEIYIPTDVSGDGKWVQFDIFDSYGGGGGNPISGGEYNITVKFDEDYYIRPDTATITAIVSSDTDPLDGLTMTFEDYTTGQTLGQDITDITGSASIQVDFNSLFTVGPHLIEASYDFFNPSGYNLTTIYGNVSIVLTNVNPGEINISDTQPDIINVTGFVYDPLNEERVEGPELDIRLFENGTFTIVDDVFSPSAINTTRNGVFTGLLDVDHNQDGYYEVQADLNGAWWVDTPLGTYNYSSMCYGLNATYIPFINSSNRIEFNITKEAELFFYIDGIPSNYNSSTGTGDATNSPIVLRTQTLNLTARVFSELLGPYPNKQVFFYDSSRGDVPIGSATTDINGNATINYNVGSYCRAGPNLLYARLGTQENYSYFILDDVPTINIISGPSPQVINRSGTGTTQFNIVGEIYDSANNSLPISYSEISLIMRKGGYDYSSYLEPSETYPYQTDSSGTFDLTFGVQDNTPPGNYTLRLDFNGTIDLLTYEEYPYLFNLSILSTSTSFTKELKIEAEASFYFFINGTTSDDYDNPLINRYEDLNLTAYIHTVGIPISDGELVDFYDTTQDNLYIGSDTTTNGYATYIYKTNGITTAGPHLIYAMWNNRENYSYFILDAPINVSLNICPQPREVNRTGSFGRNFIINGSLIDGENGNPVKYGEINVFMKNGATDVSSYLNLMSGSLQLGTSGEINLTYSVATDTPAKNYSLHVDYNGTFIYTNPNYPQYFDLWYITNFSDRAPGLYDLSVFDPENITIYFFINGTPTQSVYSDSNFPERFSGNEQVNFSVIVVQSGSFPDIGNVYFTDVYTGSTFGISLISNGFASNLTDITSWHGGLHRIEVQWSGGAAVNRTYIIINKTANIFATLYQNSVTRDIDNFKVNGTLQENGVLLRGLTINIILLDSNSNDVSLLYLSGSRTITINDLGYYQFDNSVTLNCPQGRYYIRVDFNGSINAPGIFLTNYMIHNSSDPIPINITAGTNIIQDSWYTDYDLMYPEYSDRWIIYDTLHVNGTLTWDNGSAILGMNLYINVTVKLLDGTVITFNATSQTDSFGVFDVSIYIDISDNWPEFRDQSEIWVYFNPIMSGVQYIEGSYQEFT